MASHALERLVAHLSDKLLAVLDLESGAIDAPIRAEVFGLERFSQHGHSLGLSHLAVQSCSKQQGFVPRLRSNIKRLRLANEYIGTQAQIGYDISPAAQWLLENFHLLEAQFKAVDEGLPSAYFRGLPVLSTPPLQGLPRIYGVAWAFVAHTDSEFDEALLSHFLEAYQQQCELNLSELWALPTTLRVVLMENLRRLADRVANNKAARELANVCCDHLVNYSVPALMAILDLMRARGIGNVFLAQIALRLQANVMGIKAPYKDWLHTVLPDVGATLTQQRADQAADNLSVSNAVTALRSIADADWSSVIAHVSTSTRMLLNSEVFAAENDITRAATLQGVERLAKRSAKSETHVAQVLLATLAQAKSNENPHTCAPGYWLTGDGRSILESRLGLNHPWRSRFFNAIRQSVLVAYIGAIALGTLGLLLWLAWQHHHALNAWGQAVHGWWLMWIAMAIPVSQIVVVVVHRLLSESIRPLHLPRLALPEGITAAQRVMVVIPCMLRDVATMDALVHRLELHYLANVQEHAQFALLSDWVDAPQKNMPEDAALLAHAQERIVQLNAAYPRPTEVADMAPRFLLLHRDRQYSHSERCWMGWERKRGKLEQLLACLVGATHSTFLDLQADSRIEGVPVYLLTLDAETQLPPGSLCALVGIAAHPSNQARLDSTGRIVLGGYGVLQPRVATTLAAGKARTLYHWLFSGHAGIDPYSSTSSEVYQDVFHEGTFSGKGLMHVATVHRVLAARFPSDRVLSHDLLEGALVRCAAISDVIVLEGAPHHTDVALAQWHRWARGDWQLLPFMLQAKRYGISPLNLWKMLDNLRRSLLAPACLSLLVLSLLGIGLLPGYAVALVLMAYMVGPGMGAIAGFFPSRPHVALHYFYAQACMTLVRGLGLGLWNMMLLLQHAMTMTDAVIRACYRMVVSHHLLLQWMPAQQVQTNSSTKLKVVLRKHMRVVALAFALAIFFSAYSEHKLAAWGLCLVWALSPLWIWGAVQAQARSRGADLSNKDKRYLQDVAQDTWQFFERCITAEDHYLPPDNFQIQPTEMLAHRTSPTNMGLYLLSTACAHAMGWISLHQMLDRLEATLDTLQKLPRYRGHFYNWYDTQTLLPLLPQYVSAVDSGNFSGHALSTAQACLECAEHTVTGAAAHTDIQRLQQMAASLQALAWEADYAFLYHAKRKLFHIGYRVLEQQLDESFYDMLASEARLTSMVAIAKGDVPHTHWAALGRTHFVSGKYAGLRSWSGSMFEYFMPSLVLEEPCGSLLRDACVTALRAQKEFALQADVPWGISESAYAGRDHTLAYQYAAQGVPRLALRRTPVGELVVAPYATALAASIAPQAAVDNLRRLEALGARQLYGFVDALDYSPARQISPAPFTVVATYMAHHQGMMVVALSNVLLGGIARRWGMADARMEATAALLQECMPLQVSRPLGVPAGIPLQIFQHRAPGFLREIVPATLPVEPTHLLSNGRYSVALRANGAGWSRWERSSISRWRDDVLRDGYGTFFFLRSLEKEGESPRVSLTQRPAADPQALYGCTFHADRVIYEALWSHLRAQVTVWVSPEDDVEFRQVELCNLQAHTQELEVSSAFEVTMAPDKADEAHPVFSSLFVSSEWLPSEQCLMMTRKARTERDSNMSVAHFVAYTNATVQKISACSDRQRWYQRQEPAASDANHNGLDPVAALLVQVQLSAHATVKIIFATAAASSAPTLHALRDKYRQPNHVQRASSMSATLTGIRLRALRIHPDVFNAIQTITTSVLLHIGRPLYAALPVGKDDWVCDKSVLWRWGISGDRPIVLVTVSTMQGLGLIRALTQGLRLWLWAGVVCDLVVINTEPSSYYMALQHEIMALLQRFQADCSPHAEATGVGFFVLNDGALSADERSTLYRLARMHVNSDGRPLVHHISEWCDAHRAETHSHRHAESASLGIAVSRETPFSRAKGAFDTASGDFSFQVNHHQKPVRPWVNVLANPKFGTVISESGGGYSWAINSRLNQLTPWSNDPVLDPPGQWWCVQDLKSGDAWTLTPGIHSDGNANFTVVHGQGFTRMEHKHGALSVEVTWCVDRELSVQHVRVKLTNRGYRHLALRLVGMVEWIMGASRQDRGSTYTTRTQPSLAHDSVTVLTCTQRERSAGFGNATAFLAVRDAVDDPDATDWTCDRHEWIGVHGKPCLPKKFLQRSGEGLDPCAVLSSVLELAPGAVTEHVWLMGFAWSQEEAVALAVRALATSALDRQEHAMGYWSDLLGATTVNTPDPLFDLMVNRWLPYQTVVCRLWAKAGFYQAGGATGFRDQLQDSMALVWAAPAMLRAHIVLCASRQFEAGDVQHWWHDPRGVGVRTHFSDDLLWLPYACTHYLRATADTSVLDERVAFLQGQTLSPGQEDAYFVPHVGMDSVTIYEHIARALDHSMTMGVHDLPLMGSGDWNDGMNTVGVEGKGESVWLGWFVCDIVAAWLPFAQARGEHARAQLWEGTMLRWKEALRTVAWDGQWFKRAFFDDGTALGAHLNTECKVDLIAQAWAVLSDVATPAQQTAAMQSVEDQLVDHANGLIQLLTPALQDAVPSAGYIQAYPKGVRENGGQYSHAAVWALMAQAKLALHPELPYQYFTYLSPAHRSAHPVHGLVYGLEPYVMAGDVYSQSPYQGRGGWSWYTGAAGWMHRAAIESIVGLDITAQTLSLKPCLPAHWPLITIVLRRKRLEMRFTIQRIAIENAADIAMAMHAQLLMPTARLDWSVLSGQVHYLVPITL